MGQFLICDETLKFVKKFQQEAQSGTEQGWFCYDSSVDYCSELIKGSFREQLIVIFVSGLLWRSSYGLCSGMHSASWECCPKIRIPLTLGQLEAAL